MKIKTDEQGRVTGFCTLGDMDGAVEYTGVVPDGFADHSQDYRLVDGVLTEDADLRTAREAAVAAQAEMAELLEWFDWYDNQCMQYQRAARLGEDFDQDMTALDAEARQKQLRLRTLRGQEE